MNPRISFDLGHPAHYLLFRDIILNHDRLGFDPVILIQKKDRLEHLLREDGQKYYLRLNKGNTLSRISLLPKDIIQVRNIFKEDKVKVNFGKMSIVGSWAIRSLNKRSIIFDDTDTARGQISLFRLPANEIWTPEPYSIDFGKKHRRFRGIFQLAYLHPSIFKPNKQIVEDLGLLDRGKPIIIRIIDYQAAHDWKFRKIKDNFSSLLKYLEKDYDILLSVEGNEYPKAWKKYIKSFNALDYHHIINYSALYIGGGASTAAEAAVLGVPSIYTNFIKPCFIRWIENEFNIIKSMPSNKVSTNIVDSILEQPSTKWQNTKNKIIESTIDVPKMMRILIKRELEK